MRFEPIRLPDEGILDARPRGEGWFCLRRSGPLDLAGLSDPLELHLSGDGRFAAVVERFGRLGRVFDLDDGRRTMSLDRGEYPPATMSVFPAAFLERGGRTLVVHGTDWNRLDVSDPATGESITVRGPTVRTDVRDVPPHYLDYFHAGLCVSPDGRWVAEDGWYWHPMGELRVWLLDDWLGGNVWESEDGASIQRIDQRVYFWDTPMCWIDATRLAFWGEGDDVDAMQDVMRVVDVLGRQEVLRLSGVSVAPPMPWPPGSERSGWLAFDGWLFAVSPALGTGVWDLATGERVHFEAGFAPRRYHAGRKEFLSWGKGGAYASRLVLGGIDPGMDGNLSQAGPSPLPLSTWKTTPKEFRRMVFASSPSADPPGGERGSGNP